MVGRGIGMVGRGRGRGMGLLGGLREDEMVEADRDKMDGRRAREE